MQVNDYVWLVLCMYECGTRSCGIELAADVIGAGLGIYSIGIGWPAFPGLKTEQPGIVQVIEY